MGWKRAATLSSLLLGWLFLVLTVGVLASIISGTNFPWLFLIPVLLVSLWVASAFNKR